MSGIRIVNDFDECVSLWNKHYPVQCLFDLWQVREAFSQFYERNIFFIVHEENEKVNGLLPLCKITQTNYSSYFAFFPGEVWKNRTWMEQNKIIAENSQIMDNMLHAVPENADIRYLCKEYSENDKSLNYTGDNDSLRNSLNYTGDNKSLEKSLNYTGDNKSLGYTVDEIGYLFYPKQYGYNYEQYLAVFAGKSRKKILSEVRALEKHGVSFRYNNFEDLEDMFRLNISNFGEHGYFHDTRFLNAFIHLARIFHEKGMLRVVTVLIGNEIAAVDMGAMWNNTCTMLAGGTNKNFPGIAKLINLHHMAWACDEKLLSLDFLCGDFGWKERFHLTPRPLYKINITV